MGRRHSTASLPAVDHYAAVSLDGGNTWSPNLRLTEKSSDFRLAPPTLRGYLLGDYLGLAALTDFELLAVAVWCDTRAGKSDPFATRFARNRRLNARPKSGRRRRDRYTGRSLCVRARQPGFGSARHP